MISVAVIGSGISGLYTAYNLLSKHKNCKVVIYEKNNYIGGRVLTHEKYGYEIGAGRFGSKHKLLLQLIKDFELDSKLIPISNEINYIDAKTQNIQPNNFYNLHNKLKKITHEDDNINNNTHTTQEYIKDTHANINYKDIETYYEYSSDISHNSCGYFIKSITNTKDKYYVLAGGLTQIITKLTEGINKLGGIIKLNTEITDIKYDNKQFTLNDSVFDCVVITIPTTNIKLSKNISELYKLNKLVKPEPLYRIYACYPNAWFENIGKIVTNSKIKYIIPINKEKGIIMISYTDGKYAKDLKKIGNEKEINKFIETELNRLFPNTEIPKPIWVNHHYWNIGSYYWHKVSSNNVKKLVSSIVKPLDNVNMYIIGDSFSNKQAWIEGALETSEMCLNKII
jgi:monoamine oxidase